MVEPIAFLPLGTSISCVLVLPFLLSAHHSLVDPIYMFVVLIYLCVQVLYNDQITLLCLRTKKRSCKNRFKPSNLQLIVPSPRQWLYFTSL